MKRYHPKNSYLSSLFGFPGVGKLIPHSLYVFPACAIIWVFESVPPLLFKVTVTSLPATNVTCLDSSDLMYPAGASVSSTV